MSSIFDPTVRLPLVDKSSKSKDRPADPPIATENRPMPPSRVSLGERLRPLARRTPVTWVLVAANVVLFAAMSLAQGRMFHFRQDALLGWGGGLAPRLHLLAARPGGHPPPSGPAARCLCGGVRPELGLPPRLSGGQPPSVDLPGQ